MFQSEGLPVEIQNLRNIFELLKKSKTFAPNRFDGLRKGFNLHD